MFSRARLRLTLWFAGSVALILVVIGSAVFLSARAAVLSGVNDDLEARARREVLRPLTAQGRPFDPRNELLLDLVTAGGYFYAILAPTGAVLQQTPNLDPTGLPDAEALPGVDDQGPSFMGTTSAAGDHLRVYVAPLSALQGRTFYLVVGRSIEPERQALGRLLLILAASGGAGLALSAVGGFFLAGRALRPIQTAVERQRAFVADASHELRTPLTLIRANAELLKRKSPPRPENALASVDDIIRETDRLANLVSQMLTLARAETDKSVLQMSDVDLGETAADAVRQMQMLASPKKIALEFHKNGQAALRGDETRLRELVTILVDNAIKYSPEGSSVGVSVVGAAGKVILSVSDNGPGIPPEALPRIFDRFYRVDKARSREAGGTGLGLSIARWIAESHGGSISATSAPGRGTTFTVELPATG